MPATTPSPSHKAPTDGTAAAPALAARALLLDMDGTLVDSTAVVERTWHRFAARHGLDPTAILAGSHGRRTGETVALHAPPGVDVAAETAQLEMEEVADVAGVVAVPGAAELLAGLPPDRWAVVTSAGRELTERRMAAAGLCLPPTVVTADDVAHGKPNPEGYLVAAGRLGVRPEEAVVFEDAEAGMRAADAAGARWVAVGRHGVPDGLEPAARVADFRGVRLRVHADGLVLDLPGL